LQLLNASKSLVMDEPPPILDQQITPFSPGALAVIDKE
jgi:hypothetical protein